LSRSPHLSFRAENVDKGCGVNRFNIAIQAEGAGLLGAEPARKKARKPKKIDILRSKFTKLVCEKYSTGTSG